MKTIDQWLQEAIDRYERLTGHTEQLGESIRTLSTTDITDQCTRMAELRREITTHDEKLHELLTFLGGGVLDNPLLGSYQQALSAAIDATERIAAKAQRRKEMLLGEIVAGKKSRHAIAGYNSGTTQQGVLQKVG
jgi:hypothetical protein